MAGVGPSSQTSVSDLTTRSKQKIIYVTYLIAALDITWMFLQFSVTPYLARKLGFDTLWFGYLQTMVGVIQLLGGPLFGRFADLAGARAALGLSCAASVLYFLLLAIADNPLMLFIHKLPAAFMHVLPGAQMIVTDLTEPECRADALAKLGICFGIGMIAGSTLGGSLSTHYGETFTACVAASGSFVSLVLVWKFIPKNTKPQAQGDKTDGELREKNIFNLREITRLMRFPNVTKTFTIKIISGLPAGIFQVMFSVIAINFFQLQPEQNGYLMAYFGLMQMGIQGVIIGPLTAKYSENILLLLSVSISSLVGLAQAYMMNVFQFCFIAAPMMFSLSVFNVITDSMLTKSVPSSDTGTMLGLCASVQSLLRTVGPTIGGFLYHNYGVSSFGFIQFVVNVVVLMFLLRDFASGKKNHRA
ncbi:solute carrier family 22 member 18 [Hypomesus transpacificus]|uniref:solute carrier family 22 member 18 n=1 Tax=Hypomesus transpacificus TaxID=137520 RepID=UPI001F07418A|nr:solute carrier family 22 member 18 [Hypomesus transpacificus]